jgi:hypothetical protein
MPVVRDFIHLPYTPDLTQGGIACAFRILPNLLFNRQGSPYERLRRIVAATAVEMAFRRYLSENEIPYEVESPALFTDPERYTVSLRGRRCELITYMISRPDQASRIELDPGVLLDVPALVPSDWNAREEHADRDLYLFAFLPRRVALPQRELKEHLEKLGPQFMVHVMDDDWRRPQHWNPLGRLALKSESEAEVNLEIHGQDGSREFTSCSVCLPSRTRIVVDHPFHAITSLHADRVPDARLGMIAEMGREMYLIKPAGWANLWFDGSEIILAGCLTRGEFRTRAVQVPAGSRVFQFDRTHVKNLAVPVSSLKPIRRLIE